MTTTVVPARGKLYVERRAIEKKVGSIIVAKTDVAEQTGIVRAVGAPELVVSANGNIVELPVQFKAGQVVAFNRYASSDKAECGMGDMHLVLDVKDVLAVVVEAK